MLLTRSDKNIRRLLILKYLQFEIGKKAQLLLQQTNSHHNPSHNGNFTRERGDCLFTLYR